MGIEGKLATWQPEAFGSQLLETTIGDLLDRRSIEYADRPALIFEDAPFGPGVVWTYSSLRKQADRLAKGLIALGVRHGSRVAVLAPNSPEWVTLEYALAKIGAILVTVNTAYKSAELRYLLRQGAIEFFFTVTEFRGYSFVDLLEEILPGATASPGVPALRRIVLIGNSWRDMPTLREVMEMSSGVHDVELVRRQAAVSKHDIAQIQYTSGTTGAPKGAMLSHYSTVNNANLMSERAEFGPDDRMISAMPMFHTAGCVCNVLGMMTRGGCLIGMPSFDAGRMLQLVEKHRATVINAVPTMFIRMLEDPQFAAGKIDCSSVRVAFTGGTSIPPVLMRELKDRMGADPMIIMGMTETSPIITQTVATDDFEQQITTAGIPLPFTEVRVVDPSGQPVECGQTGELQIRGYLVMKGYFDLPEQSAATIDRDGWLRSGDLAVLEQTGHLRIVGRIKDMIIRGGENIYPAEIEEFLLTHPAVSQAQVVGVADAEMGEEAFAFVVLREGYAMTCAELSDYSRQRISRHKVPRYFELIDAMPLTASGKVKKYELREIALELIQKEKKGR
jgi:fatty-acyl-CoA synthase